VVAVEKGINHHEIDCDHELDCELDRRLRFWCGSLSSVIFCSLHETVAAIDLAEALGAVSQESAQRMQQLATRIKRMLRALLRKAG
jgi:hypothetical protein